MSSFQRIRPEERMLPVEEAQQRVLDEVGPLGSERIPLLEAPGRVLREDVRATHDAPQADNTAMDGYAAISNDLEGATPESPVTLRVIEDLPAGGVARKSIEPGTATRIMTGAPIPRGADVVVHVELTDAGIHSVRVFKRLPSGTNIRRRGEDMRAGEIVLRDGMPLGPGEVGVLASVQRGLVEVGKRPVVAILSTGDELVAIDQPLAPGKVVNSNSYSLASLVSQAGGTPRMLGIVPDTREATMAAITSALESDMIVSSGGVSVGTHDFVKDALEALGAETKFWQVAMKPGKPIVLSRLRDRLYFGLPGNPVSCMVSLHLFVAPAIRKAMGQKENLLPPIVNIRCDGALRLRGDRRSYVRVRVVAEHGALRSVPMPRQGSGVSTSMVAANGLAIVEAGVLSVEAGTVLPTVLIGRV